MDRVLIIIDNIQFSSHLANTLRKVGYDTESIQNEFNLAERVLAFNPDIIIVRGATARLSSLNVGKKLKDSIKFKGKVILIFHDGEPNESQLETVKSDFNLLEPASALRITTEVLNLEPGDQAQLRDRLFKLADDDLFFKTEELTYLRKFSITIEEEIAKVKSLPHVVSISEFHHVKSKLKNELKDGENSAKIKIEKYNDQINKIDVDLKKGLSKRYTKSENKVNRKVWNISDHTEASDLDQLRKEFTNELFKKKNK